MEEEDNGNPIKKVLSPTYILQLARISKMCTDFPPKFILATDRRVYLQPELPLQQKSAIFSTLVFRHTTYLSTRI